MKDKHSDQHWMAQALAQAELAKEQGEVPVGAVLVKQGECIGEGFNRPITTHDCSAHAEIEAIRQACQQQQNYRLPNTTLYVSLEPCAMCAGAIVHARIARVVIATKEPRAGAGGSLLDILNHPQLNHRCEVEFGVLTEQSSTMLKQFFKQRRANKL